MTHDIALIPGDGIGKEVVAEACRVLERRAAIWGFDFEWTEYDWGCEYYAETGLMMPEDGLESSAATTPSSSERWAIPACRTTSPCGDCSYRSGATFEQYINLRPVRLFDGHQVVRSRTWSPKTSTSSWSGRTTRGSTRRSAAGCTAGPRRSSPFRSRSSPARSVRRTIAFAFELAKGREGSVTSATKSNGIIHTMPFWDEIFDEVAARLPGRRGRTVSHRRPRGARSCSGRRAWTWWSPPTSSATS